MDKLEQFYINGCWVAPSAGATLRDVVNPATEAREGQISLAQKADVDAALQAAHDAFAAFSQTSVDTRLALIERVIAVYERRMGEVADALSREMGAPHKLAIEQQAPIGVWHLKAALEVGRAFPFERRLGNALIRREPIGVCALITPWNWPMNQILCKVAPALVAGCTMVLKPSEVAPLSAHVLAEIFDEAGAPPGVFNMLFGRGAEIGPLMSSDARVDMVSLTGSNRAGASVAHAAADSFKRLSLELGGKSANIILPGADLQKAVSHGVRLMMSNTGQSCDAPSRMLVREDQLPAAEAIAAEVCAGLRVGDPLEKGTEIGPIANVRQFDTVKQYIHKGLEEGARLVCGGPERPAGVTRGYFIRPTVFSGVDNKMAIAQEEIFGPVLVMIPYQDVDDAVRIANDNPYGLSGYVYGRTEEEALAVARRMRTGMVLVNEAELDMTAAFGGYKYSGIGREWGQFGLEEFLETKSMGLPTA